VTHWFALVENCPLFAFAGIWRPWTGERKGEAGEHQLFAFLTTESNDIVRPIPAKAMPVLLTASQGMGDMAHGLSRGSDCLAKAVTKRSAAHCGNG
jgi:hypothetical protein